LTPLRPGIEAAMSAARDRIVLPGMIGWGAFILLKNRPMWGECPEQAQGRLTTLQKILGKSQPWWASNHFLHGMTNLMKVCRFCNPVHILADGTGALYLHAG